MTESTTSRLPTPQGPARLQSLPFEGLEGVDVVPGNFFALCSRTNTDNLTADSHRSVGMKRDQIPLDYQVNPRFAEAIREANLIPKLHSLEVKRHQIRKTIAAIKAAIGGPKRVA